MRHLFAVAALWFASAVGASAAALPPDESAGAPGDAEHPYPLMVGDPAPPLTVSRWLERGPVRAVQPGKPYVVEFWATWCIPCIAGIPHLTELQAKYGDRVTIAGIAVWEQDRAEAERFIAAQGDRMRYLVGLDEVPPAPPAPPSNQNPRMWLFEQGLMSRAWLRASGQTGIPVAFVVDAEGRIAWIGEPQQMDGPLSQIVAGTWDLQKFAAGYRERMTAKARSEPIAERLEKARRSHNRQAALAAVDELLALGPTMAKYAGEKFDILLTELEEPARAYAYAREAIGGVTRDDYQGLNRIAGVILKQAPLSGRDLDLALDAAERSAEVTQGKHSRTLKLLAEVHATRGELDEAVEVQRRAIAVAYPEEKPEFELLLAEYERELDR